MVASEHVDLLIVLIACCVRVQGVDASRVEDSTWLAFESGGA